MSFVEDIAGAHGVSVDHLVVQYLLRKTRAADRGSKARRSLGNLYALMVLAEDYKEGRASRFTDLLARMRDLPFGAKLQNHPLDNRLNDEFARQLGVDGPLLPVEAAVVDGQKSRRISEPLMEYAGADPSAVATVIIDVVRAYIEAITKNQESTIEEIQAISDIEDLEDFFERAFSPTSDARLFEIASFVLLQQHYRGMFVYVGASQDSAVPQALKLYRTGRTNANDGGIDFVLQPLGRFFQVTETLDFKKYFLDFEKVNRFPLSFVIKVDADKDDVIARIRRDAERSGEYGQPAIDRYMSLFDEIFTVRDLRSVVAGTPIDSLGALKDELQLQFQLEYGLLD